MIVCRELSLSIDHHRTTLSSNTKPQACDVVLGFRRVLTTIGPLNSTERREEKTRQSIHPPKIASNRRSTRNRRTMAGREQNRRLTSLFHELAIEEEGEESTVQVIAPSRVELRQARKSKLPHLSRLGPQQSAGMGPVDEVASASGRGHGRRGSREPHSGDRLRRDTCR